MENMIEAAPEGKVHSRHDGERVKRALRKLHTNLGHPGRERNGARVGARSFVGTGNSGGTKNAL